MASPSLTTANVLKKLFSSTIPTPSTGFAKLLRAQPSPPPPFGAARVLRSVAFPATGFVTLADGLTPRAARPFHIFALLSSDSDTESDSDSDSDSDSSFTEWTNVYEVSAPPFKNPLLVGGSVESYMIEEDDEAKYARFDMPGIGKEDLKVWVENNDLKFQGVEPSDSETKRSYFVGIELDQGSYVVDQIKAEVSNGVLKVVIPKVKLEDRSDVLQIEVN